MTKMQISLKKFISEDPLQAERVTIFAKIAFAPFFMEE